LVHIPRYYFSVYVALLGRAGGQLPGDGMVAGTRTKRLVEEASSSWNWPGIGAICENGRRSRNAEQDDLLWLPLNPETEPPTLKEIMQRTDKALPVFSRIGSDGEGIVAGVLPSLSSYPNRSVRQAAEVMTASYAAAN